MTTTAVLRTIDKKSVGGRLCREWFDDVKNYCNTNEGSSLSRNCIELEGMNKSCKESIWHQRLDYCQQCTLELYKQ